MFGSTDPLGTQETPKAATLTLKEFAEILNDAKTNEKGFGAKIKPVEGPGKLKALTCEWTCYHSNETKNIRSLFIHLIEEGKVIASMLFASVVNQEGSIQAWELTHRTVSEDKRKGKIGSFSLKTGEEFLALLHKSDYKTYPNAVISSSTRPSVNEFALSNGYAYTSLVQEQTFKHFLAERELQLLRDPEKYRTTGELDSFLLVKVKFRTDYSTLQDPALIDKEKLKEFEAGRAAGSKPILRPDTQSGFQVLETATRDEFKKLPFLVRIDLRKELPA